MNIDPNNVADWYGFIYDKWLPSVLGPTHSDDHPDLCRDLVELEAYTIASCIVEDEEAYTWEEAHQQVLKAGAVPLERCSGCACGRYSEVDGVAINARLIQAPRVHPERIYRAYCEQAAPDITDRLMELVTSFDEDLSAQGAELHLALLPPEADRWYDRLIGFMTPRIRREVA